MTRETHPDKTPVPTLETHHHRPVVQVIFLEPADHASGDRGYVVRRVRRSCGEVSSVEVA